MSKPKAKLPRRKAADTTSVPRLTFAAGAAVLALLVAFSYSRQSAAPAPPRPALVVAATTLSERMAAESPQERQVHPDCEAIRPLWGGELSCRGFLAEHWESAPKLSRPGAAWVHSLFTPSAVGWMIRQWPVRFYKNHGTALLQKPGASLLCSPGPTLAPHETGLLSCVAVWWGGSSD